MFKPWQSIAQQSGRAGWGAGGIHSAQELIATAFLLKLCHGSKQGKERRRLLLACDCAFNVAFSGVLV